MEVNMPRSINKVELVFVAFVDIVNCYSARLHRDAALAFDIKIVKNLFLKLSFGNSTAFEQQLVRERTLPVVDVGDNRKVTDKFRFHSV